MMENRSYFTETTIDRTVLWKNRRPVLARLDIELTERCNNNCIHCCINLPQDDLLAKQRELSTGEIKKLLEEAAVLGAMTVRFTGGEPLLREDIEELYVFARKLGLKVLLFTNARLITPRLAELFARIPPLERIEITVYGMKKGSYEAVSQIPGSFKAAWRGINLLFEKKVPFVVKGALLPPNKREMEEFEAWGATIPWMDKLPSYSMFFDFRYRRDSKEKNRQINAMRLSSKEGLDVLTRDRERYIKGMKEFCSKFTRPPGDILFSCGSGRGGGCVDAYGYFYPCLPFKCPDAAYDLRKGSLKDALENVFPRMREIKAENPDYLKRCAKCFLKGLCEQCPAKSWMEHGVLDKPVEYLCEIAHAQARYLGLIEENEAAWEVKNWRERISKFTEDLSESSTYK